MIPISPTAAQVRQWILSLLPGGADKIYSLQEGDGGTGDYFGAIAAAVKAYGTDLITTLRNEVNPATATGKLDEWEAALALSSTTAAQGGTTATRQAQVVAALRGGGTVTIAALQAAVQPFVLYPDSRDILIIECPRATLTALHTYAITGGAIPNSGSLVTSATVADQTYVSQAGPMLTLEITHGAIETVSVQLADPDGGTYSWDLSDYGSGAVTNHVYNLWAHPTDDTVTVGGGWILTVTDTAGGGGTLVTGANTNLFVEGVGRVDFTDLQGLGSQQFVWVVAVNAALATVSPIDVSAIRAALSRMTLGHTQCFVVQYMTGGGLCAVVDDPNAIANGCVAC